MKKNTISQKQFRGGYAPNQPVNPDDAIEVREAGPPTMRRRNSVSIGSQTEANPGMVGKQDYKRKR